MCRCMSASTCAYAHQHMSTLWIALDGALHAMSLFLWLGWHRSVDGAYHDSISE
jgi:hypothetical protein